MVSTHRDVFVTASYEFRTFVVYDPLRERTGSSVFASHAKRRKFGHVTRHWDAIYDLTDFSLRRVRVESRDYDVFVDVHRTLNKLFKPRKKLSLVYGNYVGVVEVRHVYHVEDVVHFETRNVTLSCVLSTRSVDRVSLLELITNILSPIAFRHFRRRISSDVFPLNILPQMIDRLIHKI